MRIGGIQKHSLIDYPGRVSCVVFLSGCNFACPYCHNPQLAGPPDADDALAGTGEILSFLAERRRFLDGVVVSGGEPTLHPGLPDLCRRVKALGFPLKLDTNGSRPKMLKRLLAESLVDYVALDIKTEPARYGACAPADSAAVCGALLESLNAITDSGIDYELRTTCVRPLVDPPAMARIGRLIEGCRLYILQAFRPGRLLRPDYFKGVDPGFTPAEMQELKAAAEPFVQHCSLR